LLRSKREGRVGHVLTANHQLKLLDTCGPNWRKERGRGYIFAQLPEQKKEKKKKKKRKHTMRLEESVGGADVTLTINIDFGGGK